MSEGLEDRIKHRRSRRWKRRARMAAPFAALPFLFAALVLSVDIIEYQPQKPRPKLADRPLPKLHKSKPQTFSTSTRAAIGTSAIVDENLMNDAQNPNRASATANAPLIPMPQSLRPPTPPYALQGR